MLTEDNEEVRLAGILAPTSDGGGGTEAMATTSRTYLEQAIGDETIFLAFTGPERDRYGRLSAQVFLGDEWMQAMMLRAGMALAAPDILTRDCAGSLLEAESQARSTEAGLWADDAFSVLQLQALLQGEQRLAGSFQIVEATIVDVGEFRGRYFLNFGEDRETDFTVTVSPRDMRYFRQSGLNLDSLAGHEIRVRGWLESYNGPNMPVSIPEVIEVID